MRPVLQNIDVCCAQPPFDGQKSDITPPILSLYAIAWLWYQNLNDEKQAEM